MKRTLFLLSLFCVFSIYSMEHLCNPSIDYKELEAESDYIITKLAELSEQGLKGATLEKALAEEFRPGFQNNPKLYHALYNNILYQNLKSELLYMYEDIHKLENDFHLRSLLKELNALAKDAVDIYQLAVKRPAQYMYGGSMPYYDRRAVENIARKNQWRVFAMQRLKKRGHYKLEVLDVGHKILKLKMKIIGQMEKIGLSQLSLKNFREHTKVQVRTIINMSHNISELKYNRSMANIGLSMLAVDLVTTIIPVGRAAKLLSKPITKLTTGGKTIKTVELLKTSAKNFKSLNALMRSTRIKNMRNGFTIGLAGGFKFGAMMNLAYKSIDAFGKEQFLCEYFKETVEHGSAAQMGLSKALIGGPFGSLLAVGKPIAIVALSTGMVVVGKEVYQQVSEALFQFKTGMQLEEMGLEDEAEELYKQAYRNISKSAFLTGTILLPFSLEIKAAGPKKQFSLIYQKIRRKLKSLKDLKNQLKDVVIEKSVIPVTWLQSDKFKIQKTKAYEKDSIYVGVSSAGISGHHYYLIAGNKRFDGTLFYLKKAQVKEGRNGPPAAHKGVLFRLDVGKDKVQDISKIMSEFAGKRSLICINPACKILDKAGVNVTNGTSKSFYHPKSLANDLLNGRILIDSKALPKEKIQIISTSYKEIQHYIKSANIIEKNFLLISSFGGVTFVATPLGIYYYLETKE